MLIQIQNVLGEVCKTWSHILHHEQIRVHDMSFHNTRKPTYQKENLTEEWISFLACYSELRKIMSSTIEENVNFHLQPELKVHVTCVPLLFLQGMLRFAKL